MCGSKLLLSLCLLLVLLTYSCHSMRRRNRRPQPKGGSFPKGGPSKGSSFPKGGPPKGNSFPKGTPPKGGPPKGGPPKGGPPKGGPPKGGPPKGGPPKGGPPKGNSFPKGGPPKNIRGCHFYQSFDGTRAQNPDYSSSFGTVEWVSDLTDPTQSRSCSRQGVLKIVPGSQTRSIEILVGLENPEGYNFNIGDDPTNNGWGGGDAGSGDYVAEIHNIADRLVINKNLVNSDSVERINKNTYLSGIASSGFNYRFFVDRCQNLKMSTVPAEEATTLNFSGDSYFEFDDLYVGMNRVIKFTSGRVGAGGCDICVRFSKRRCFVVSDTPSTGKDK